MTATYLRGLLSAQPFVAFRIHLTNGTCLPVPHPDFAWAQGRFVVVVNGPEQQVPPWMDNGHWNFVPLLHVARVEFDGPAPDAGDSKEAA